MDKIERKWEVSYEGSLLRRKAILDKLDEIIDWINAREEREGRAKALLNELEAEGVTLAPKKPSIEQELESGLVYGNNGYWYVIDGDRAKGAPIKKDACTRIFLPAAKYMEYAGLDVQFFNQLDKTDCLFHDIPVFSYSGDEIIFCTD